MNGSEPSWLLVRTQPRREQYAQSNVETWSHKQTYLPRCFEDGKIKILFPSYLFVLSDEWYFLRGAWGVAHVVMVGSQPARVHGSEIAKLRAKEKNSVVILPKLEWQVGDPVEVTSGAFQGFDGLYEGMAEHNRVKVLLALFGRQTVVEIERPAVRRRVS